MSCDVENTREKAGPCRPVVGRATELGSKMVAVCPRAVRRSSLRACQRANEHASAKSGCVRSLLVSYSAAMWGKANDLHRSVLMALRQGLKIVPRDAPGVVRTGYPSRIALECP
jgi:hypothetical protein